LGEMSFTHHMRTKHGPRGKKDQELEIRGRGAPAVMTKTKVRSRPECG